MITNIATHAQEGPCFATMRHLHTTPALGFDGDFAAAGFTELRT